MKGTSQDHLHALSYRQSSIAYETHLFFLFNASMPFAAKHFPSFFFISYIPPRRRFYTITPSILTDLYRRVLKAP